MQRHFTLFGGLGEDAFYAQAARRAAETWIGQHPRLIPVFVGVSVVSVYDECMTIEVTMRAYL
jgi:hypothetical protein